MKAQELRDNELYPIIGWEGLYSVDRLGNIYSIRNKKFLSPELKSGYHSVTLSKNKQTKKCLVHRIVAITFIENHENKPCVNHIDGDKTNNNVVNLEWVTHSENEKHSHLILGKKIKHSYHTREKIRLKSLGRDMSKQVKISAQKRAGKPSLNVRPVILNGVEKYPSITLASKAKGVSVSSIANNIKGLSKTTKSGTWQYLQHN